MTISSSHPDQPLIPQADPGGFYRSHQTEIDQAISRVLESGWYILGKECAAFELEFARALGLGCAIGVASGTDALILALRGIGISPGDRVATVSHTAVATVAAIEMTGAIPVFVDIDPATFTMDPEKLAATLAIVSDVKAVIIVHLYGHPADISNISEVAQRFDVRVIEDCAQAHGARINARPVGTEGDAAAFSFYPTKNLGAFGDGGAVAANDPAIIERIRILREYGWKQRYISEVAGMNSRLDELQAAILRVRLHYLGAENQHRRTVAAAYTEGLADTGLRLPIARAGATHVFHQYVVRHPDRDAILTDVRRRGVVCNIHYPVPVHLQPAYAGRYSIAPGGLRETEAAARTVLSLPMHPGLDDEAVAHVIETFRSVLSSRA